MSAAPKKRPRLARLLWGLSALLALVLVVKYFVADVYRISSESMRPTLFGGVARDGTEPFGEWVLVRYGEGFDLQRQDLVVLDRKGMPALIKRVLGLPGESIRIVDGDVFVDGERPPRDLERPALVPVFDSRLHPVLDPKGYGFHVQAAPEGPWEEQDGTWRLDGPELGGGRDTGRSTGLMHYRPDVRDGYLDQEGQRIGGFCSVNDLSLSCQVLVERLNERLRFQLTEAGDLFEARFTNDSGEAQEQRLELVRIRTLSEGSQPPQRKEDVLASLDLELPVETWFDVRFFNVDNVVGFQSKKLNVELSAFYEQNERFPGKPPHGDQNVGVRVGLGGEGLQAQFRSIQIFRDLHYAAAISQDVAKGADGAPQDPITFLGPEEIYLLGDNSSQSIDSRSHGPYSVADLIGRPVAVVWPPSRWRFL